MRRLPMSIVLLVVVSWGCSSGPTPATTTVSEPTSEQPSGWLVTTPALECANNSAGGVDDEYVDVGTDDPDRLIEEATAALIEAGYMFPGETLRIVGEDEPTGLAIQSPEGRTIAVFSLVEDHKFGPEAPGPGPFITQPLVCIATVEARNETP